MDFAIYWYKEDFCQDPLPDERVDDSDSSNNDESGTKRDWAYDD